MQSLIKFESNYVTFDFETKLGQQIKIIGTYDDPYFCGKDVCTILEYKDIKKALQDHVKPKHKKDLQTIIEELGGVPPPNSTIGIPSLKPSYHEGKAIYVSEPGLYALIMKSRTSFAETFQDFVYEQILPSIRKRGRFQLEQVIEQKEQELKEQRRYTLELKEGLLDKIPELKKTQVVYIATSHNYAKRNLFKVGGIEHADKLVPRLATYNTGRADGDDYFYVNVYHVNDYREVENRLKKLLDSFKDRKQKEMYRLCHTNLVYVLNYIVEHFNEEVDEVNKSLEQFINALNSREPAVPVTPLILAQIHQRGTPDVVLAASNPQSLLDTMTKYVNTLDKSTSRVKAKEVFDKIQLKEGRRAQYPILERIIQGILPNAVMTKF